MSLSLNIIVISNSAEPLVKQIERQLRDAILSGKLGSGDALPSTQRLANELDVSQITVIESYCLLTAQGLIETGPNSNFQVSQNPARISVDGRSDNLSEVKPSFYNVSQYCRRIVDIGPLHESNPYITSELNYGSIATDLLPIETWRQLMSTYSRSLDSEIFDPWHDPKGFKPLRDALAEFVSKTRGVRASSEQIAVFSGYQPAMECIARVLVDAGDLVAAENPGYVGASRTFEYQGAKIETIDADLSGMDVQQIGKLETPPKVILTTPSLQEPTGVAMSIQRRKWLLDYASQNSVFIIEDDYDSEYIYGTEPVPSLFSMDDNEQVIFVGNFRKMLYPLIRLAFVVLPPSLVRYVELAKSSVERDLPMIEQCALNDLIASGDLERHVKKTQIILDKRRQALLTELKKQFADNLKISRENSGTHIMVHFETQISDDQILEFARACNANLVSLSDYYLDSRKTPGQFLWSYLSGTDKQIENSVLAMSTALQNA